MTVRELIDDLTKRFDPDDHVGIEVNEAASGGCADTVVVQIGGVLMRDPSCRYRCILSPDVDLWRGQ